VLTWHLKLAPVNIGGVRTEPKKSRYHHGDLRNALIAAGGELAEQGGPGAVTVRAAARAAGVSATAAYRHFAGHDELLQAVREQAIRAVGRAMVRRLAALEDVEAGRAPGAARQAAQVGPGPAGRSPAMRRMAAIGRGYIDFALAEPGLFRMAFDCVAKPELLPGGPPDPSALLAQSLDELVAAGELTPQRRAGADLVAWAVVHGLAVLLTQGPLTELPAAEREQAIEQTLQLVAIGLTAPA
jgi:AcrR family transcriptional regulator